MPSKKKEELLAAKNPAASAKSLAELFDKDDSTNRLLAKHPKASAELLEKLSHSSDKATRRAVTQNPNTDLETYVRLGQQFPKEFLTNPALDLLLFDNPGLIDQLPISTLVRLLKADECPASLLNWGSVHSNVKVQLAVVMNVKASEEALESLRNSQYEAVTEVVKAKPNAVEVNSEDAYKQSVRDRLGSLTNTILSEAWVYGDIGIPQWSALPLAFRLSQATDRYEFSPAAVARILHDSTWTLGSIREALPNYSCWSLVAQLSIPEPVLEALSKDSDSYVRRAVARNPVSPVWVLESLTNDADSDVSDALASNPSISLSVIELLAKRSAVSVQEGLLKNVTSPLFIREQLLEKLGKSRDESSRAKAAADPGLPLSVLKLLSEDKRESVRRAVAKNPSTPLDILKQLSKDSSIWVRRYVGMSFSCPMAVLEELASDSESWVRCGVAHNSNASISLLEILARDSDREVRGAVAENPSTPKLLLEAFSRDADKSFRRSVANNHAVTSCQVLDFLADDKDSGVRVAVAANPATSSATLTKLATDPVGEVVIATVNNPNTPLPSLISLIATKALSVRLALAGQAHRSTELCRALWQDVNEKVRLALVCNLKLDQEVLDEMAQSTGEEKYLAAMLKQPNLSAKSVEFITNKLLTTKATESPWYISELEKVTEEVRSAARANDLLYYCGKEPNKAVLSKRPLASLMALCSGPFVEPSRIAKVVGSTDWLVRAAAARNPGTPPNLLIKLSADTHPLVAKLARRVKDDQLDPIALRSDKHDQQVDLARAVHEVLKRFRKVAAHNSDFLFKVVTDSSWSDQTTADEIISVLHLDEHLKADCAELENCQLNVLQESMTKSTDTSLKLRLAKSSACLPETMRLLANDNDPDVILEVLRNPTFPEEERKVVVKSLSKLRGFKLSVLLTKSHVPSELYEIKAKSNDPSVRRQVAASLATPQTVLRDLSCDLDNRVRTNVAGNPNAPLAVLEVLSRDADVLVRMEVASNQNTSAHVLEALSKDSEVRVRRNIPSKSSTLMDLLKRVDNDTSDDVRAKDILHSTTPVSSLTLPAQINARQAQTAVILNHDELQHYYQTWVLRMQRAKQREICMREGKVPEPQLPIMQEDLLRALEWLGCVSAADDNKTLTKATHSKDWLTRLGVAFHPAVTEGILMILRKDSDPDVARAAMSRKAVLNS